jgi:hypothetical protein
MKWCQAHWDALREGVKARRMWRFVPQSGEEAFDNTVLELQGHGSTFDPLSGAMWQLTNQVMENIGKSEGPGGVVAAFGDPQWCPMCEVQASYDWWDDPTKNTDRSPRPDYALNAQGWIDGKLDGAAEYVKQQGWKLDNE